MSGQDRETAAPASLNRQARRSPAPIVRAAGPDPPRWFGRFVVNVASLALEPPEHKAGSFAQDHAPPLPPPHRQPVGIPVRSRNAARSVAAPPCRTGARGLQSRRPGDTRLARGPRRYPRRRPRRRARRPYWQVVLPAGEFRSKAASNIRIRAIVRAAVGYTSIGNRGMSCRRTNPWQRQLQASPTTENADASREAINIRFIGVSIIEDRCSSANLTGALTAWFDGAPLPPRDKPHYSRRQRGVILWLRLTNQPGPRACTSSVPTPVRG